MKSAAIAFALKKIAEYLKKHPEMIRDVSDRIPGKLDDYVIRRILGI